MDIVWDQIANQSADYNTQQGWFIPRRAIISGVTNTGAGVITRTINDAIAAGLLPELGDGHPDIANAYCEGFQGEVLTPTTIRVAALYRQWAVGSAIGGEQSANTIILRGGLSLGQTESNTDRNGVPISVPYTKPDGTAQEPQGAIVPLHVPEQVIEISLVELVSPATRARPYMKSTNMQGWFVAPLDPAGVWKFMGCAYESRDLGLTWMVTYNFQYREAGWNVIAPWIDPTTGRPPPDASFGNGMVRVDQYPSMNYNTLLGMPS